VFFAAAAVFTLILALNALLLKSSPADVGQSEPAAREGNLFGQDGNAARPKDLFDLLLPFFLSVSFWLVCAMNFGLTLIRETFNFWTPTYLTEFLSMSPGTAAQASSLFPLFGGFSVIVSGFVSDSLFGARRGLVVVVFLVPAVGALVALAFLEQSANPTMALVLISGVGFLILGPYAFLTGAISVDLGGKRGSSTAAGLADTAGYVGAYISGEYIGSMAQNRGWTAAMSFLAGVLAATAAIAIVYWYIHEHRHRPARAQSGPSSAG
jgi:OPA family glycerol-3-phosphate transporter-like MFS transporter